jgi:hypothetical protein
MSDQEKKKLQPVEQKEVDFYDDTLVAIRAGDGRVYVSVRHMAEALGLTRQSQVRRIDRQPILADGHFKGAMMTPKGKRQANWLRVDLVPLFLAGIDTKRVREDIREKLERYQREAANVLWEAFQQGRLTTDQSFGDLLQADTPAVQAYRAALAVVEIARQQVVMEATLVDHEQRLESIESQLGAPDRRITPEQASQISQAVKAIALILTKRSGINQYGSVYGEMYRKFGITSYKRLPESQFEACMEWLTEWYQSLTDDEVPF